MNDQPPQPESGTGDKATIDHLLLFFALVYVVEGVGQISGLISQPLNFYLKEVHGWTPCRSRLHHGVQLPWIIKPVYGIVSDFVPLFGYRRKSYLHPRERVGVGRVLFRHADAASPRRADLFALLTHRLRDGDFEHAVRRAAGRERPALPHERRVRQPAMALVQRRRDDRAAIGGQLVQYLSPTSALHGAALIVAMAPLMVVFGTWFLVAEEKRPVNLPELKAGFRRCSPRSRRGALDRRVVSVSLLLQSGLHHAALSTT